MSRDDFLALMAASGQHAQIVGPTVRAVRCPAGHPTPEHVPTCRVCRRTVVDVHALTIARPMLGVLKTASGDEVPLDRDVIVGRSPSDPAEDAADRPNLVRLDDPAVSRTHARIELEGWHVLVRDLGSLFGTEVVEPGQAPEKLEPMVARSIQPGTRIILAGEVDLTFEVVE